MNNKITIMDPRSIEQDIINRKSSIPCAFDASMMSVPLSPGRVSLFIFDDIDDVASLSTKSKLYNMNSLVGESILGITYMPKKNRLSARIYLGNTIRILDAKNKSVEEIIKSHKNIRALYIDIDSNEMTSYERVFGEQLQKEAYNSSLCNLDIAIDFDIPVVISVHKSEKDYIDWHWDIAGLVATIEYADDDRQRMAVIRKHRGLLNGKTYIINI